MTWITYFAINLFCGFMDLFKIKQRFFLLAAVSLNIFITIGLRYKLGVDWVVYEDLYDGQEINVPLEPGYILLNNLFSMIGIGFWGFVFCITTFSFFTLYTFFKIYPIPPILAIALYFTLSFSFNIEALRQILAVSFSVWAVIFYLKRQFHLTLCMSLIAMSMHFSSIILLLIPFINTKVFRKNIIYILAAGILLAIAGFYPIDWIVQSFAKVIPSVYFQKIMVYTDESNISNVLTFNLIFKLMIFIVLIFNQKEILSKLNNSREIHAIKISFSIFFLMLFVDIYLGRYGTIRLRLDEYFQPFFVLIICYILTMIRHVALKQIMAIIVFSYLLGNIYKFTLDDYFINQFEYNNVLSQMLFQNNDLDNKRSQEVIQHWAERQKVNIIE